MKESLIIIKEELIRSKVRGMHRGSVIKAALWRKPKKENQSRSLMIGRELTEENDIVTPKNMKILNET